MWILCRSKLAGSASLVRVDIIHRQVRLTSIGHGRPDIYLSQADQLIREPSPHCISMTTNCRKSSRSDVTDCNALKHVIGCTGAQQLDPR